MTMIGMGPRHAPVEIGKIPGIEDFWSLVRLAENPAPAKQAARELMQAVAHHDEVIRVAGGLEKAKAQIAQAADDATAATEKIVAAREEAARLLAEARNAIDAERAEFNEWAKRQRSDIDGDRALADRKIDDAAGREMSVADREKNADERDAALRQREDAVSAREDAVGAKERLFADTQRALAGDAA